jgi:glycerol kinase
MSETMILGIDQSTSGTKAMIFSREGVILHRVDVQHEQIYPKPGWVEHNPLHLYQNTIKAAKMVITEAHIDRNSIAAVAITNQRETAVVWDKDSGLPVYNAVVWQCNRGQDICEKLRMDGHADRIQEKSGLILSPYFSAAKIAWILDNVSFARENAERGALLCGTVDSWLIWKLTGGVHATDYSNASRTQLFNLTDARWDPELLSLFRIPESMLPAIRFSDEIFGETDFEGFLPKAVPITGVMGDSHAALFGHNCFRPGMAKATYGTGSSIMMNIGTQAIKPSKGLVATIAWGMNKRLHYALEGNINCTGATIQWLVDDLGLINSPKEAGKIASSIDDNEGVYLVPAFVGLSAPYWDSEARASITGMSRGTKKAHVVRAAEESIAYQIKDVVDLMIQASDTKLLELRVDGGPTKDTFLMQFQADLLGIPVVRSAVEELSATGSAYMAGLAVGFWKDESEISRLRPNSKTYQRSMDAHRAEALYAGWKQAVRRTLSTLW